jgi:N6-L-threonylcarbamoyladenine synthase
MTRILGIESTCDETAAAVVDDGRHVISSVVASQIDLHARFGGVVPELASRAHLEAINTVIEQALRGAARVAGVSPAQIEEESRGRDARNTRARGRDARDTAIDAIAVAHQPGLIGSLLVGLLAAKTLAWVWSKPLVAVNHVHAHAYSPALDGEPIEYPAVALIASGGHTSLYRYAGPADMELLGATIDDAAGEAFDKVAAILNLPYPGGPAIDNAARTGNPAAIRFPRALLKGQSLDFSFSGLKTAVLYHVRGVPGALRPGVLREDAARGVQKLSPQEIADIAASFQAALVETLTLKIRRAAKRIAARSIIIGGGVAANSALRSAVTELGRKLRLAVRLPAMKYCMDNAAMTAGLGYHLLQSGQTAGLDLEATATVRR